MRLLHVVILFVVFTMLSLAHAKNPIHHTNALFLKSAPAGITYLLNGQNLTINIEQKKLLKMIPKLQKAGYLNRNLSTMEIDYSDALLAGTLSIRYVANIVHNIYRTHATMDKLHVDAFILAVDVYGNNSKNFCYSFDFNHSIYQKINWDKFKLDNLKKIALDFKSSNLCQNVDEVNPDDI